MEELDLVFSRLKAAVADDPGISTAALLRVLKAVERAELAAKSAFLRVAAQVALQPLVAIKRGEPS